MRDCIVNGLRSVAAGESKSECLECLIFIETRHLISIVQMSIALFVLTNIGFSLCDSSSQSKLFCSTTRAHSYSNRHRHRELASDLYDRLLGLSLYLNRLFW